MPAPGACVDLDRDRQSFDAAIWRARLAILFTAAALAGLLWFARERLQEPETAPAAQKSALDALGRQITLGESALFAGTPGGERLSVAKIHAWLDDPRAHRPLDYKLPLWLRADDEQPIPPADDTLTFAKIELGRQLFLERRFVGSGSFTCVECHHPKAGFSRATTFSEHRNPLPVVNRILSTRQFWDGRADSLEHQVEFPLTNVVEMKSSPEKCEEVLRKIPGYRIQFERIYGGVSYENMTRAIAAFERALVTGPGAYDYYRVLEALNSRDRSTLSDDEQEMLAEAETGAKEHPMSEAALRGAALFFSDHTGCANCHSGPNFTDEQFHNLGVGHNASYLHESAEYEIPDVGRYHVTHDEADKGAYKTPTLRNLRDTSPYFHDGSVLSLPDAVQFIVDGGNPNPNLSPMVRKLELSPGEVNDLVAFLESLQGELPEIALDRLPE